MFLEIQIMQAQFISPHTFWYFFPLILFSLSMRAVNRPNNVYFFSLIHNQKMVIDLGKSQFRVRCAPTIYTIYSIKPLSFYVCRE